VTNEQKIEEIPTMSAAEYVVEVFKRTYRTGDAGQWERSDAVRDAVEREMRTSPGDVRSGDGGTIPPGADGSYRIIETLAVELHKSGIAEDLAIPTIAKYRIVANAWPEEERFEQASYDAHRELATKTYDRNRVKILDRLVRRSSRGIVTRADVRTYKSEMKPKVSVPWEDRFHDAIWSTVFTRDVRPQAPGEYDTAIQILQEAVSELRKKAGIS
jgi:hypothetical protein